MYTPFTSAIIPTYNRKEILRMVLSALLLQSYPENKYEIIVADDGSSDGTGDMTQEMAKEHKQIKYFFQEDKGFRAGTARNLGAKHAMGSILIFLDNDVVAEPDLIRNYTRALQKFDVAQGYTAGYFSDRKYSIEALKNSINMGSIKCLPLFEEFRHRHFMDQQKNNSADNPEIWHFFVSNNFAIKKKVFQKEQFDESFVGWGGEDSEFGYRLCKQGFSIGLAKECIGFHAAHEPLNGIYNDAKVESLLKNLAHFYALHPVPEVKKMALEWFNDIPAAHKNEKMISDFFSDLGIIH